MTGERAERFVVASLRLLALAFAVVGVLFIAVPDGVLDAVSDVGDAIGDFARAPATVEKFWLALGFAYMVVIAGICATTQLDVVRYRPMLLVLAAGKAASSLGALAFFVLDRDVFIYLLNFVVDGLLFGAALALWALAGRVTQPTAPP